MICQLLEKSRIGADGSGLPDGFQCLCGRHSFPHHEKGSHDRGRPGPSHDAVDHDQALAPDRFVDEFGCAGEISRDVGRRVVVDVETVVRDPIEWIFVRIDRHVALGRVQDVSDPNPAQIVHVLDGVTVAKDDPGVNLIAVNSYGPALGPVRGGDHSGHHAVLSCPRVDYGVDQVVSSPLPGHGGRFQAAPVVSVQPAAAPDEKVGRIVAETVPDHGSYRTQRLPELKLVYPGRGQADGALAQGRSSPGGGYRGRGGRQVALGCQGRQGGRGSAPWHRISAACIT